MKEHPVLFNGAMIRAILAGTKTQTRRPVTWPKCASLFGRSPLPERSFADGSFAATEAPDQYFHAAFGGGDLGDDFQASRLDCPLGSPGDRLWVRETWAVPPGCDDRRECFYRADLTEEQEREERSVRRTAAGGNAIWTPSIHMPRWLSRIVLEVTATTVQRAHSITAADVRAEGVPEQAIEKWAKGVHPDDAPGTAFGELWDSVYGKKPGLAWKDNPWCWVTEFKRVEPSNA